MTVITAIQHQAATTGEHDNKTPRLDLLRADTMEPEAINWLWRDWLAAGKVHLLAGRAGTGKTTLALKMAATISAGGTWPDGSAAQMGDVIIWSAEDGVCDTLLPRLIASGADRRQVHFVGPVTDSGHRRAFVPATDTPLLGTRLSSLSNPKLLIIDPVVVAVSGDSNKGGDVRRGLQPLADLAERQGIAVLGITHFNKGMAGTDPLDRVTGSLAFGAVARIVMGVSSTPETGGERRFVRLKSNIGSDEGGFGYILEQRPMESTPEQAAQTIKWGHPLIGSGRELIVEVEGEPVGSDTPIDRTREWLKDLLQFGGIAVEALRVHASEAGHAWRTVERAKQSLGIKARKRTTENGGWEWELP